MFAAGTGCGCIYSQYLQVFAAGNAMVIIDTTITIPIGGCCGGFRYRLNDRQVCVPQLAPLCWVCLYIFVWGLLVSVGVCLWWLCKGGVYRFKYR